MDTTPLIDKYRNDETCSDAGKQNMERQLRWLDSTLGYSVFSVSADSVRFYFVNHTGEKVYQKALGKR